MELRNACWDLSDENLILNCFCCTSLEVLATGLLLIAFWMWFCILKSCKRKMTVIDVYLNIPLSDVKEAAVHQWPVNGRKANDNSQPEGSVPTTTLELCVFINVSNLHWTSGITHIDKTTGVWVILESSTLEAVHVRKSCDQVIKVRNVSTSASDSYFPMLSSSQ